MISAGMTDKDRFSEICSRLEGASRPRETIGTYGEKSVHYALKLFFEDNEECREVPVGKFIADIKNGSSITEIQSSGFGALKHKLEDYFVSDDVESVNLVYPVIAKKRVIKISRETGEVVKEYNSPRHVSPVEIFKELLFVGDPLFSPKLSFTLVMLEVCEMSFHDEGRKKRNTVSKIDKIPKAMIDIKRYDSVFEMGDLFSFEDGQTVTAAMIRKELKSTGRNGWAAIKIMELIGYLTRSGKEGNKILYQFTKCPVNHVE